MGSQQIGFHPEPAQFFLRAHNPKMVVRIFGLNGGYDWQFQRKVLVIHGGAQVHNVIQNFRVIWVCPNIGHLNYDSWRVQIYDDVHHFRWILQVGIP